MDHLETEARNPASERLDELSAVELVRLMNAEDARVLAAVAGCAEAIASAIEVIAGRLGGGRKVGLRRRGHLRPAGRARRHRVPADVQLAAGAGGGRDRRRN